MRHKRNKADRKGPAKWEFWNIPQENDADEDEPSERLMVLAVVLGVITLIVVIICTVLLLYLRSGRNHRLPDNDPLKPRFGFTVSQAVSRVEL